MSGGAELMGDGNKVEFLVAICALITSIMAVYMAWDQGRVMRAQQHGMVYPVLQVEGSSTNTSSYSSIGITVKKQRRGACSDPVSCNEY